jgi:hypothetical protein
MPAQCGGNTQTFAGGTTRTAAMLDRLLQLSHLVAIKGGAGLAVLNTTFVIEPELKEQGPA